MAGIADLPKAKWDGTEAEPILLDDFIDIESAILQLQGLMAVPSLIYSDATAVKITASTNTPVGCLLNGFPNVFNPALKVDGGLTDGKYRVITADISMDFDVAANIYGVEKASNWYAIYAIAADGDAAFTLKAMPYLRVSAIDTGTNVITIRNNLNTANRGYGFALNEFNGAKLYFLSGSSQGIMLPLTANDTTNSESTGGTLTYSGTDPSGVAAGDWFIILPVDKNFRWLGDIYNSSGSDILRFAQKGTHVDWYAYQSTTYNAAALTEWILMAPPLATMATLILKTSSGAGEALRVASPDMNYGGANYQEITPPTDAKITFHTGISLCKVWLGLSSAVNVTVYGVSYDYPAGLL